MLVLTKRQKEYLDEIKRIMALGEMPTYSMLARKFVCAVQTAKDTCYALQAKGYIRIEQYEIAKRGVSGKFRIVLLDKSLARLFVEQQSEANRGS